MLDKDQVLLLLGGNIGDPREHLAAAERRIAHRVGTIEARSRDHWTEPDGFEDDRLFLNRAVVVNTSLEPMELMAACSRIEQEGGREERPRMGYAARSIDIDILLYGDRVIEMPLLHIPHPRMHIRRFALAPAADLYPHVQHPLLNRTILEMLNALVCKKA